MNVSAKRLREIYGMGFWERFLFVMFAVLPSDNLEDEHMDNEQKPDECQTCKGSVGCVVDMQCRITRAAKITFLASPDSTPSGRSYACPECGYEYFTRIHKLD